ncbi:class I adenylate-forming enzyme family protein [Saccharopolyspora mangrovi]|uniref:Class I adenylate-forming enzyme family protein n=1 Tax=Saccharopolyspora mangrovi TaxID=3082379 RepID=A0ABU6A7F4_9PSEU|nr:class I adenylate-forming enzyme family protein [Saccharopolyspora sp. S2-29]MEB3367465.1 class I adenylate-forming enzyme family protein [Saccharopolyspora sp. S2-29]
MTWTSRNGVEIRDLVPAELRRHWVEQGVCPDRAVYAQFTDRVRAHPHREAVIDGEVVLDYRGLDDEVRRVAAALSAEGFGAGDIIGIRMPNGWRTVVAELALAAIGAVTLPCPDGRGTKDLRSLLSRSRAAAAVFADPADVEVVAGLPELRSFFFDDLDSGADWHPPELDPEAPVRILVTSGSQLEPKMIAYSHNAMTGGRANYVRELSCGEDPMRALVLMKLSSSYGSLVTHVGIAALGATAVLQRGFDAGEVLRAITRHRPTHLFGVPTMLRRLSEHPGEAGEDLSSLRGVVSSAAPLSDVTARACTRRFGTRVITVYGSSDGVNCHTARTGTGNGSGAGLPDPAVAEIRVVDELGRDAGPGEPGEIWARGPMTPLCHVAAPELDARRRTRGGWVRSGDRGVLDELGRLHVLGRLEQVVLRGGLNISPAEVEREIVAHPAVVDVACVPVPDDELGERLCACISQASGSDELSLAEVVEFLEADRGVERSKLPEYLLRMPELPLAPTGKVCRRTVTALAAEHFAAGQPAMSSTSSRP